MSKGFSEKEYQELVTKKSFPFLNRAISGVYPPGSVFKIVTASGILEEGIAKPEDSIFDEGYIKIGESVYGNWKRDGHGVVNYTRSMKVSNDTYYYIYSGGYKLPKGLGISGIYNWSKKYKLGEIQGIDLPGEALGFIPDGKYKTWYLGDTFISAIGQGDVLSTPLQMSVLMSYYANNQKAFVPRVVLEADNLVKKEKVLYENLLSTNNFEVIKNSLKEVNLPGGTAFPFFDFKLKNGFESAGKTGTSEYFDSRYKTVLTHAWYSGFAPYERGEIVVTVFIESGGGGSTDAAPIARKLMDYYFENKN
jgi:penicillin-binding protein 2